VYPWCTLTLSSGPHPRCTVQYNCYLCRHIGTVVTSLMVDPQVSLSRCTLGVPRVCPGCTSGVPLTVALGTVGIVGIVVIGIVVIQLMVLLLNFSFLLSSSSFFYFFFGFCFQIGTLFNNSELMVLASVARSCIADDPLQRPSMKDVVRRMRDQMFLRPLPLPL